jgi:hypothetical protein
MNQEEKARDEFLRICEAYDVLSDREWSCSWMQGALAQAVAAYDAADQLALYLLLLIACSQAKRLL